MTLENKGALDLEFVRIRGPGKKKAIRRGVGCGNSGDKRARRSDQNK
jgi:hypothetical protein